METHSDRKQETMSRMLALLLVSLFFSTAIAGTGRGKIQEVSVAPNSPYVMFRLSEPLEEVHRCNECRRFSVDLRTVGGRASYEVLLRAKQNAWTTSVQGLNTCNEYDAENVKNVSVR